MSESINLDGSLEQILAVLGEEGRDVEERIASASGIARRALSPEATTERNAWLKRTLETGMRWEALDGLRYIASYMKWHSNKGVRELGYEATRFTLDGLATTHELPGQEVYGALGQELKTALTSTFERLRAVLLEGRGGLENWKDRLITAEELAQDALGVIRPLALTLNLVDTVNPSNRPIVEEAIGRGMFVWWMAPDDDSTVEPAVFEVLGRSGAYVADDRGIRYTSVRFKEAAKLIFGNKEPADLCTVSRIEFDRLDAEQEMAYRRGRLNNIGKENRNAKE
jgi:hypothetical protein